jgi:1-deoxy-D-xylulose-5-phosphate synthase
MRWVKPLDETLIARLAADHELLVTVEDNAIAGGAGSGVCETLARRGLHAGLLNLGLPDRFLEHGSRGEILAQCGLDAEGIERSVNERRRQRERCARLDWR